MLEGREGGRAIPCNVRREGPCAPAIYGSCEACVEPPVLPIVSSPQAPAAYRQRRVRLAQAMWALQGVRREVRAGASPLRRQLVPAPSSSAVASREEKIRCQLVPAPFSPAVASRGGIDQVPAGASWCQLAPDFSTSWH